MKLGRGSYSFSEGSNEVIVGNYSSIADQCIFQSSGGNHECIYDRKIVYTTNWEQQPRPENITIGSDVWICKGVRILSGITIGDGAIIGAGAVIHKDVPPYAVVVGNPQRITRYRFYKEQIKKLLRIKWWDWSEKEIEDRKQDLKNIDTFVERYG